MKQFSKIYFFNQKPQSVVESFWEVDIPCYQKLEAYYINVCRLCSKVSTATHAVKAVNKSIPAINIITQLSLETLYSIILFYFTILRAMSTFLLLYISDLQTYFYMCSDIVLFSTAICFRYSPLFFCYMISGIVLFSTSICYLLRNTRYVG